MRWAFPLSLFIGCADGGKDDNIGDDDDDDTTKQWECALEGSAVGCDAADSTPQIGCQADFDALASLPIDASIPGARSVKTIIDLLDGGKLHFMNSVKYPIHWEFAFNHLSVGQGLPPVPDLAAFNGTEYYSPDRRFILGAIVYYEGPQIWTYEIAPYDAASPEMVAQAFELIQENAFFGDQLKFHPSSSTQEVNVLPGLPDTVPVVSTDELFQGVDYQPYNVGEATGLLTFRTAAEVDGTYTPFRELVVLDAVPNEISIVAGIITAQFQTPLAHINVLSINRGSPNMGLRDAQQREDLKALEGKWVKLEVDLFEWSIEEITAEEAETWWQEHKPEPLASPPLDLTVTDLRHVEEIVDETQDLETEIDAGISRFGAKGTNYAALYDIGEKVPIQPAIVIPFYWYDKHMRENGLLDDLIALMDDPDWTDPGFREEQLTALQGRIAAAPLDPELVTQVIAKRDELWPGELIRFRSSTNAEDLGNFTGAGLYGSYTGDPALAGEGEDTIPWAIKTAWASLWTARAYEERSYYSIDQLGVAMALLTTPNFPEEEVNGVAITNNLFDSTGLEPGFYVNAQIENYEIVQPGSGIIPDAYIHYFYTPGQPVVYTSHSNLIEPGQTVMTNTQINELGIALDEIHRFFYPVFGDRAWYGMDVEFKFDDKYNPGTPELFIKQARPFPWTPGGNQLSVCEE
jgi:hypothetical protein